MKKTLEDLEKELSQKVQFIRFYVYLIIIPVTLFAFLLAIPIIVWRHANMVADTVDTWFKYKTEKEGENK